MNIMKLSPMFSDVKSLIAKTRPPYPVLCFEPARISTAVKEFQCSFPGKTSWSVKSNPSIEIIREVIASGIVDFDVSSLNEIEVMASSISKLNFNNPVKLPEEIEAAYFSWGVRNFTVDCIEEFIKINEVLCRAGKKEFDDITILVRFRSPNAFIGNYDFGSKFGAHPDNAAELLRTGLSNGYKIGLAFHPGSQTCDPKAYEVLMQMAHQIALKGTDERIHDLNRLNIGGGFPTFYSNSYAPPRSEFFEEIRRNAGLFPCVIFCEPGRALVADCLHLLARVNLRRKGERKIYINDGVYGSLREFASVDFMPPARAYHTDGRHLDPLGQSYIEFEVFGPTCDSLDKLKSPLLLPEDIQIGDYIEFGVMGAYTNATQTKFNGIPAAKLVQVKQLEPWWSPHKMLKPENQLVQVTGDI